jgi:hypothetical protein
MRLWMLQKEHFMRFLQSLEKNYRRLRDDYRRRAQNKILKQRWAGKSDRPPVAQANGPSGLDRCEIHYIDLKHREDRRAEIQSELPMVRLAAPNLMKPCFRRRQS